eukprot:90287_1
MESTHTRPAPKHPLTKVESIRSCSGDSVFDWGLGGEAGSVAADISRYDPGAMSRVTDIINDLGDDSDDSDSEHGGSASTPRMGGVGISRGESKRKKR